MRFQCRFREVAFTHMKVCEATLSSELGDLGPRLYYDECEGSLEAVLLQSAADASSRAAVAASAAAAAVAVTKAAAARAATKAAHATRVAAGGKRQAAGTAAARAVTQQRPGSSNGANGAGRAGGKSGKGEGGDDDGTVSAEDLKGLSQVQEQLLSGESLHAWLALNMRMTQSQWCCKVLLMWQDDSFSMHPSADTLVSVCACVCVCACRAHRIHPILAMIANHSQHSDACCNRAITREVWQARLP